MKNSTISEAVLGTNEKPTKKNKLMTAIIAGGIIVLGLILFFVFRSSDNLLIPVSSDGERWGFINRKGEFVINPQFEDADFFNSGLAKVQSNGRIGYINKKGDFVIPATYKSGTSFDGGLAFVVADGGHPTAIDKKGKAKFVLNVANFISAFSEDLAIFITEEGKHGFVDRKGNIAINAQFDRATPFINGFARIWQNNEVGFIDKTGKIVINPQFRTAGNFNEKMAAFSNGQQWGYINTKGAYIINPQFDDAGQFSKGLAAIQQGRMYGFIDKKGKLVINPQFDDASVFSDGLAAVQQGNRWGYIDKKGKYEINPQFDRAGRFHNGRAIVRSADRWGLINKKGQYVVNPQFRLIKDKTSTDERADHWNFRSSMFIESDFYDASEFVRLFFQRENGNTFDSINASSTLEQISNHPRYGAGLNTRDQHSADFSRRIQITDDIAINLVRVHFNTPIFRWVNTGQRDWWGNQQRRQQFDFSATPDAIMYTISFSGRAANRGGAVINALKNEIERCHGKSMESMTNINVGRNNYYLLQDGEKLSFAVSERVVDGSHIFFQVAFNQEYLLRQVQEATPETTAQRGRIATPAVECGIEEIAWVTDEFDTEW
ncbi:MAG: WG repeat-containing protein [Bacteroidales bacterium]|jgi:hypothetical protein|nr:WG repeat-containing protein [Bacteroidales bacterium]